MNPKYKLKPEARKFFGSYETEVKPKEWWDKQFIHGNLLMEVSSVHVEYGHKTGDNTNLSGWDSEGPIANFRFTIWVDEMNNKEYREVSIPFILDEIQKVVDRIFKK
jgi:hypothetical protein